MVSTSAIWKTLFPFLTGVLDLSDPICVTNPLDIVMLLKGDRLSAMEFSSIELVNHRLQRARLKVV